MELSAPPQLAPFLTAVAVIVLVCQLAGTLAVRLRQPAVIGEMIGGLLLGPCALGALWPQGQRLLFPAPVVQGVATSAQLGLVVFMFLLGTELVTRRERAVRRRTVLLMGLGSTLLPVLGGLALALRLGRRLAGDAAHPGASGVFVALALSVTAVPVLGRVLHDRGLSGTRLGRLALTTSAIGDAVTWAALTLLLAVAGVTSGGAAGRAPGGTSGVTGGAAPLLLCLGAAAPLLLWGAVRPGLRRLSRWSVGRPSRERLLIAIVPAGAIAAAAGTQWLGLHPLIGAFLFGTVVPRDSAWAERAHRQLQGFTKTVLLPLFFASVGLDVSLSGFGGTVGSWSALLLILLMAFVTKLLGTFGGARLAGVPRAEARTLAALMNCRGVTDLVVISIGWQCHLISRFGFTALVLTAVVTTAATGPLLSAAQRLASDPSRAVAVAAGAGPGDRPEPDPARPLRERLHELDTEIIALVRARSELTRELADVARDEDSHASLTRAFTLIHRYHEAVGRAGTDVAIALIGLEPERPPTILAVWESDSAGAGRSW